MRIVIDQGSGQISSVLKTQELYLSLPQPSLQVGQAGAQGVERRLGPVSQM